MPWDSTSPSPSPGALPTSKIPPPPSEVVIRTMASDIASLAQTGGGHVQGETMRLTDGLPATGSHHSFYPAIFIVGFLILAAVVYFSFFYK